jgi:cellulose biosynthesis protein BcsQ
MMLAEALALCHGMRVLAIDLDPQASLSAMLLSSAGVRAASASGRTLWHLLRDISEGRSFQLARFVTANATDLAELRNPPDKRGVDVIASSADLLADYRKFEDTFRNRYRKRKVRLDDMIAKLLAPELKSLDKTYDAIIFDCPAGAVPLALAAIRSSQVVLAPTVLDDVSLRALSDFIKIILNDDLGVYGHLVAFKVVITMLVETNPEQRKLIEHIATDLYRLSALPRAIGHSLSVQRATTRLRPDSFRPATEKYGDALDDVAGLAQGVFEICAANQK